MPAAIVIAVILLAWELLLRLFDVPKLILPAPSMILEQLILPTKIPWAYYTITTLYETLVGFVLGVALAIGLATAITSYPPIRNAIYPVILAIYIMPKVALAPLLVIWFGYGEAPKIIIALLVAFFPVLIDTSAGLLAVEPEIVDVVRSQRGTSWQLFTKIRFPNALPYLFTGMKTSITLALIGAIVAEFVGADKGLGYLVVIAGTYANTSLAFASISVLTIMGILLFVFVAWLEDRIIPWYRLSKKVAV